MVISVQIKMKKQKNQNGNDKVQKFKEMSYGKSNNEEKKR